MILKWSQAEKDSLASRQLAVMKEIQDDPILAAAAETMPELILRYEQAPYLHYKKHWNTWLYCAGRGSGKTRSAIEWVLYEIRHSKIPLIFSFIAPTNNDIVRTIIEGDSGFLNNTPNWMELEWRQKDNVIFFKGGHIVRCFSAESPERLRGMNAHHALCDEIAAWEPAKVNATIHQMLLSTRLKGVDNRIVITTTPINIPYLRNLIKKRAPNDDSVIMTTGSTYDNLQNLGESFRQNIVSEIEGSAFARQELHGELIDLEGSQLFEEEDFKIWPLGKALPKMHKVVIGLDGAFTENTKNDPTGCVVLGVFWDTTFRSYENGTRGDWAVILLDAWEAWYNWDSLVDVCKKMWDTSYGERHKGKLPDVIAIENRASGIPLLQHLPKYVNERGENINLELRQATNDKFVRISLTCPLVKAGRLYVPAGKGSQFVPWAEALIKQLVEAPNGERDDMADAFAHAMNYLSDIGWVEMDFPERVPPKPEYEGPTYHEKTRNPYS